MSTATSVPSWVTAVNDAPASSVEEHPRHDRQVAGRGHRQELGQALQHASTITWSHDIAATSVTPTTVPCRRASDEPLVAAPAARSATASRTAAARLRSSVRSMSVSLRVAGRDDVLGSAGPVRSAAAGRPRRSGTAFDMEREASAVADLAKPASVHPSRNVLDSKLSAVQFPVCGKGHACDHNSTHAARHRRARRPAREILEQGSAYTAVRETSDSHVPRATLCRIA